MAADPYPVNNKPRVIAQVVACCGNTERGPPPVAVERLKSEWRIRGLLKRVQLTSSGCLRTVRCSECCCNHDPSRGQCIGNLSERRHIGGCWNGPCGAETAAGARTSSRVLKAHVLNP